MNGEKAAEHFGGYLPVIVNLDKWLKPGQKNVIVVKADNSNDSSYPPGKPQESLDFAYFGGIYRDAYLFPTAPFILRTRMKREPWPAAASFSGRNPLILVPGRERWG